MITAHLLLATSSAKPADPCEPHTITLRELHRTIDQAVRVGRWVHVDVVVPYSRCGFALDLALAENLAPVLYATLSALQEPSELLCQRRRRASREALDLSFSAFMLDVSIEGFYQGDCLGCGVGRYDYDIVMQEANLRQRCRERYP